MIDQGRLVRMARVNLSLGEQTRLDDGTIIRFDAVTDFVSLQVSYDPAQVWVLVFAITMMGGLLVSLVVRRRRLWIKIRQGLDSEHAEVEMGGLARTDNAGWGEEFDRLVERVTAMPADTRTPAVAERRSLT